ncbi:M20/M25/M40 family metallo-hydrolase [Candidatus Bathyarchaeota archaeon]|nr:M20/M25/M40 family metallo-hydrolase [Candidatus Bathyarchaeota archaeon]
MRSAGMEKSRDSPELFHLVKELAGTPGPVGREGPVQDFLDGQWSRHGFLTKRDRIGNLVGTMGEPSKNDPYHVAIVAHADAIGFIVQQVLPTGFVKLGFNTAATTPDARFLAGSSIRFLVPGGEALEGYFGLRSGHLAGIGGKKEPVLFDDAFIDLGCDSAREVLDLGIDVGTAGVFSNPARRYKGNIVGPAMDDRVGGAIQCLLAKACKEMDPPPRVTLISTVQEEIGMKGAAAVARDTRCDAVINLDVGLTGDIPGTENDYLQTRLGQGPIIVYKDFAVHYSMSLIESLERIAKKEEIQYQKAIFKNYRTDGMQFFMQGIPTVTLAIPCRYTHTNFETIREVDVSRCCNLIEHFVVNTHG